MWLSNIQQGLAVLCIYILMLHTLGLHGSGAYGNVKSISTCVHGNSSRGYRHSDMRWGQSRETPCFVQINIVNCISCPFARFLYLSNFINLLNSSARTSNFSVCNWSSSNASANWDLYRAALFLALSRCCLYVIISSLIVS